MNKPRASAIRLPELSPSIVICNLGGGVDIYITDNDTLVIEDSFVRMSLGRHNEENLDNIIYWLNQLRCHVVD